MSLDLSRIGSATTIRSDPGVVLVLGHIDVDSVFDVILKVLCI